VTTRAIACCTNSLLYEHTADLASNMMQLGGMFATCDVIFVDFAQWPLPVVLEKFPGRVIVRLHRVELYNEELYKLPWGRCETLVFIAEHVQRRFLERLEAAGGQMPKSVRCLGHVGVDLERFAFRERNWEPPWRILLAGQLVPKKRQYTAIQMLADLPEEFHLTVVGSGGQQTGYGNPEYHVNCQDLVEELGLRGRVTGLPSMPQEQLAEEMGKHHLVLSASNEEGCHTVVAEGMATGLVPLVNRWRGAKHMYPARWVWGSPKELYILCRRWARYGEARKAKLSTEMSEWAQRWDAAKLNAELADIIAGPLPTEEQFYDAHLEHQAQQWGNPRQQRCLGLLMDNTKSGDKCLDVGCGAGYVVARAAEAGRVVLGVDISKRLLQFAAEHAPPQAKFLQLDIRQQVPRGPWAAISMFDALEHIPSADRRKVLRGLTRQLAEGGRLLLTFPWGTGDASQPYEEPVHPKTVAKYLVEECGCTVVRSEPLDETYFCLVAEKGECA